MDTKKKEFQVPEHLVLADKLYAKKQHRKVLEQRLDDRIFKYRCMPVKQEDSAREIRGMSASLVLFTMVNGIVLVIVLACMISLLMASHNGNAGVGGGIAIPFLIGIFVLTKTLVPCVKMWRDTLWHATRMSLNIRQEESLSIKITDLQEEMVALDAEIAELELRYEEAKEKVANRYQ